MSTKYLQLIGSNLDSQSNIVTLKVPTLESGATDYTDADKTSVQTAIDKIAETDKPVVILEYNGSYMPANYFYRNGLHYFTGLRTDVSVDESGETYLIYIEYNTSDSTLVIRTDASLGDYGDWFTDYSELLGSTALATNNLVYEAVASGVVTATDEEVMALLSTENIVTPVADASGYIYLDSDEKILTI